MKFLKLWLCIVISILIILLIFSYVINNIVISEPVYHTITFDNTEETGITYYNEVAKVYVSEIELPESVYPNQNFTMRITIINENFTDQSVAIHSGIPTYFMSPAKALSFDSNKSIEANKTTTVEVQCNNLVDSQYVEGIGPRYRDLINYGTNYINLDLRRTYQENISGVGFTRLEFPIELKSYGHVVITEFIVIGGVIIIGCIISVKWYLDYDY